MNREEAIKKVNELQEELEKTPEGSEREFELIEEIDQLELIIEGEEVEDDLDYYSEDDDEEIEEEEEELVEELTEEG